MSAYIIGYTEDYRAEPSAYEKAKRDLADLVRRSG